MQFFAYCTLLLVPITMQYFDYSTYCKAVPQLQYLIQSSTTITAPNIMQCSILFTVLNPWQYLAYRTYGKAIDSFQ